MKEITRYFYTTLVAIQLLFIILWYINFNLFWLLSWIGRGDNFSGLRLFSPLILYGVIKILYWFAEPLSELFMIILRWCVIIGVFYIFYYIFIE